MGAASMKLRADQIDALPPEARTPKKNAAAAATPPAHLPRHIVDLEALPRFTGKWAPVPQQARADDAPYDAP